jgi:hypothetical protein
VRRCAVGQNQYSTLALQLRRAIAQLEEVEEELAGMEAMWGGPPTMVNIARYEHDWVRFYEVARARSRYAYLMEERERLRKLVATLQRKLEVVG